MRDANPLVSERNPKLIRQIGMPVGTGVFFSDQIQVFDTFCAGEISGEALAAPALYALTALLGGDLMSIRWAIVWTIVGTGLVAYPIMPSETG